MMAPETRASREPDVESQFEDRAQQADTARLGVWVFLGTEVLFFGTLFLAYTVYRIAYPGAFRLAGAETNLLIGTANTAVLLTSSYAMAAAVARSEAGDRKGTAARLGIVIAFGAVFLGLKALEYREDFAKNLLPGSASFPIGGAESGPARIFYWLYYAMTGLHAVHLGIGLILVGWMTWRHRRPAVSEFRRTNALRGVGLYWHFVDGVWVVLYPLLYLIDRSGS